jgi:hypothetical protein
MQPGEVGITEKSAQQLQYCPFCLKLGLHQLQRGVVALNSDEKVSRRRRFLARTVQVDHCEFFDYVETSVFPTRIDVGCKRIG